MATVLFLKKQLAKRSHKHVLASGRRVGRVLFALSSFFHCVVLREESISRNIRKTFGDDTAHIDVRQTAKESYEHMAMSVAETLASLAWSERKVATIFSTKGIGHVYDAMQFGKGLIFASGHYGNWEILSIASPMTIFGKKMVSVMQNFPLRRLTNFLKNMRGTSLASIHSRGKGTPQKIISALMDKNIVGIVLDHHTSSQPSIEVPFFKRPAKTQTAPAFLARTTGAPVLPAFIRRLRTDPTRHTIYFYPAIRSNPSQGYEEDATAILSYYRAILEKHIREDPGQYLWTFIPWD